MVKRILLFLVAVLGLAATCFAAFVVLARPKMQEPVAGVVDKFPKSAKD